MMPWFVWLTVTTLVCLADSDDMVCLDDSDDMVCLHDSDDIGLSG